MRKLALVIALAFVLAGCATKPVAAKLPSSHCADIVAAAVEQAGNAGVAACLEAKLAATIGVKTDADFDTFLLNAWIAFVQSGGQASFPPLVPFESCGAYTPTAIDNGYKVTYFTKNVEVFGYAFKVDPAFDPLITQTGFLALGVDKAGKVQTLASLFPAKTACPLGLKGVATGART